VPDKPPELDDVGLRITVRTAWRTRLPVLSGVDVPSGTIVLLLNA
jgi:hypothetical protein